MGLFKKESEKPAKKPAASNGDGRGRKSSLAGKKIKILAKENPRREGTHGHKSFSLMKDGMTYEEFVKAGGRPADLKWDIEKGNVSMS